MVTPLSPTGERKNPQRAITEAVHALYAARIAGAVDDFVSYFASDARLTVVGNPALSPGAGLRMGRDDIARYLEHLHDQNQYLSHSIDDIVCEGDHVLVRWTVEVRFLDNGRTGSFEVLDHIRVRDGLIVELTHFYDTGGLAIAHGRVKIA
jgi:ketosteroid isomerase-like protein